MGTCIQVVKGETQHLICFVLFVAGVPFVFYVYFVSLNYISGMKFVVGVQFLACMAGADKNYVCRIFLFKIPKSNLKSASLGISGHPKQYH
jgi:hypothetical protein